MSRPIESKCKSSWASRRKTTWMPWEASSPTWQPKMWMARVPMISTHLLLDLQNLGKLQDYWLFYKPLFSVFIAFSSQLLILKLLWSITMWALDLTQRTAWSTTWRSPRDFEGHLRAEDSVSLRPPGRNVLEMQSKWLSPRQTWARSISKDGADTMESKRAMLFQKKNSWLVNKISQLSSMRMINTSDSSSKLGPSKRMDTLRFITRIPRPSSPLLDSNLWS